MTGSTLVFTLMAIASLALALVGLSVWIINLVWLQRKLALLKRGITVPGTIAKVRWTSSATQASNSQGGYLLAKTTVRYTTLTGEELRQPLRAQNNYRLWREGEAVTVVYNPDQPRQIVIRSFLSLWMSHIIMGLVGSGFLLGSFLVFLGTLAFRAIID
ncbi:DUF3592 domain-containing protein [Synechococcales cyanobacterium C]|uniref:DUF3592 domain-containing protein n=1 Tax=Petrachloros mirabilis ULC683 TaxID=2781853 RepID=A0A8K2A989_9CYAN|nr:DUF3592 domain-containing protein [Petrachloros mirabilis]NCJ07915.1 DUF3592 domain-containing protein [Petrachloros mirabilis ULC683]